MFNVEQVRDPETRNLELDASAASLAVTMSGHVHVLLVLN